MAPEEATLLTVDNACKKFGLLAALQGLNVEIRSAEMLGLFGPNGAGKTTLIRALAGQLSLDQGTIQWGMPEGRIRLGVVPQSLAIYEDLSAEQNLKIFGRLHGVKAKTLRQQIQRALEWSNLEARRRDRAGTFSGGMKRRLNIACAVLHEPRVLLLDEPTVGVDPQSRERIYRMLEELKSQEVGILLTTHHLEEAQYRCDRIAVMDQGQIVETGTLPELIDATVGNRQRLTIKLSTPLETWSDAPEILEYDDESRTATAWLDDTGSQLTDVLQQLQRRGAGIDRVTLQAPNLHQVFLQLTGKELRE